jgi:hypothetical protein
MNLKLFLATSLLSFVKFAAGDQAVPASLIGFYNAAIKQSFALANASDAASYECVPNSFVFSTPTTVNITSSNKVIYKGSNLQSSTINNNVYTVPARPASVYQWTNFTGTISGGGIVSLRNSAGVISCYYLQQTASNQIAIVTLGGGTVTYVQQCSLASYKKIPNVATVPLCETNGANSSPVLSTVIQVLDSSTTIASGASEIVIGAFVVGMVGAGAIDLA